VAIKRGQRPLEAGDSWSIDTAPGRVLYGAGKDPVSISLEST